ncbi:CD209 antigen-like protein C [Dicentrarchus labrax]|uniref:C-type lectin domain-containing protein n=1 Tax=Dicentrarchus labrax TaxID=13489 RepID=A0A8P4KGT5_DICLA|nr:CD209 antigen-like protein C [Dicentrarchus labrax]
MQELEILDYVNEQPRHDQRRRGDENQTGRRLYQVLFLCFGMLCIIQATLNVSLRLTLYSSKEPTHLDCNSTHLSDRNQVTVVQDCEQRKPDHCNSLQERFNALTRDKNRLENRNTELINMIKKVEEERNWLKMSLMGLSESSQQCPAGWIKINSRCYFLSSEKKTWEESRQHCQSKGADLVVINSKQEQMALYHLDGSNDLVVWIGLYDTETAETFKWVDGSALTEPFWKSGQPDRGGPNNKEGCVEMFHRDPVLANWNDAPCEHKLRWLCEKDPCICHNIRT